MSLSSASIQSALNVQADSSGVIGAPFGARLGSSATVLAIGAGINAVTKAGGAVISLSASTPVTIDLTTVAVSGWAGDTAFAAVKAVAIENVGTAGDNRPLLVGNAASTSFQGPLSASATETVDAGATPRVWHCPLAAGWACTVNKSFKLDPGSNNLTVRLVVLGN